LARVETLSPKYSLFLGGLVAINTCRKQKSEQNTKHTLVTYPCRRAVSSVQETLCRTLLSSWHPEHYTAIIHGFVRTTSIG